MKLSQVKALLPTLENVTFKLENGSFVPEHFHVTEVGMITKNFIDCGGCSIGLHLTFWRLAQWRNSEHKTVNTPQKLMRGRMFN